MRTTRTAAWLLLAAGAIHLARRRRRRHLAGKVALVTGGSRGLGLILARELGGRGMRIVICARDEEELERARASLSDLGIEVLALPCDVADEDGISGLVADVTEHLGAIDVLVNNAGIIQVGPAESMRLEDYRHAMDTMFWGAVYATYAVLPQMRARRSGSIVNVTSIGATVGVPHLAPYDAAKFALRGFSEALGTEAAKDGVRVLTVVPGLMRTGSFGHALVTGQRRAEATMFSVASSVPLLTSSAERAARRIVRAIEAGETFVVIGVPAKLLRLVHALFPAVILDALGLVNRLLPSAPRAQGQQIPLPGEIFRSGIGRSFLTRLGDRAAERYNEEPGPPDEAI